MRTYANLWKVKDDTLKIREEKDTCEQIGVSEACVIFVLWEHGPCTRSDSTVARDVLDPCHPRGTEYRDLVDRGVVWLLSEDVPCTYEVRIGT